MDTLGLHQGSRHVIRHADKYCSWSLQVVNRRDLRTFAPRYLPPYLTIEARLQLLQFAGFVDSKENERVGFFLTKLE